MKRNINKSRGLIKEN